MRHYQNAHISHGQAHIRYTVTLSNGIPIESVSKMLGHSNIKTTQHYAKVLDLKVSKVMALLRQKFSNH
jgi:site-specific recombinase XerD